MVRTAELVFGENCCFSSLLFIVLTDGSLCSYAFKLKDTECSLNKAQPKENEFFKL